MTLPISLFFFCWQMAAAQHDIRSVDNKLDRVIEKVEDIRQNERSHAARAEQMVAEIKAQADANAKATADGIREALRPTNERLDKLNDTISRLESSHTQTTAMIRDLLLSLGAVLVGMRQTKFGKALGERRREER